MNTKYQYHRETRHLRTFLPPASTSDGLVRSEGLSEGLSQGVSRSALTPPHNGPPDGLAGRPQVVWTTKNTSTLAFLDQQYMFTPYLRFYCFILNRRPRPRNETIKRTDNTTSASGALRAPRPRHPQPAPREPRHYKYGLCLESSFLHG